LLNVYNNTIVAELEEERMRKVANVDFDPSRYLTKTNQKVYEEDQKKKKELLNRINHKRLLAEKKTSYGQFVSKVHRPVVSVKKRHEMELMKDRAHHPIKETKKVPSSAGYHDLYNTKGENPWSSNLQLLNNTRLTTLSSNKIEPLNKLRHHSQLASKSSNTSSFNIKHKSNGRKTAHNREEMSGTDGGSTINVNLERPPRKLLISKKKPHKPSPRTNYNKYRPSPKRLKVHKTSKRREIVDMKDSHLERQNKRWKKNIKQIALSESEQKIDKIRNIADMIESKAQKREEVGVNNLYV
jgi:hypothetical protein